MSFRPKIILFFLSTIILSVGFFLFCFFQFEKVSAATDSQIINVGFTVTEPGQGQGGTTPPPPPIDNFPSISNVAVSVSYTTSTITWNASDDKGISAVGFVYGVSTAYGNNGVVSGTYQTNLSGLSSGVLYYYKISVTDSGNQTSNYTGTFTTLSPPDNTPPIISGITATPGITTSSIFWQTNESANSQVNYGFTNGYGSISSDTNFVLSHNLLLLNLLSNTTYHYRVVSSDVAGNSAASSDATFLTLKDNVPPPDVSNLQLNVGSNKMVLTWTNPSLTTAPDFMGVKVLRKIGSASSNSTDGSLMYTGAGESFTDNNVAMNITYFYTVFSFDTSGNYSAGTYKSGKIIPPAEVCNNGVDDDEDGKADCADSDCSASLSCQIPPAEVCNNGVDDDEDGKADCADSDCSASLSCQIPPAEVCNNGIDDDIDGQIDCLDADCVGSALCQVGPAGTGQEICNNGVDDDGDGKVDCADGDCSGFAECVSAGEAPVGGAASPLCEDGADNDNDGLVDFPADLGCENAADNDEYNPPAETVPTFAKISLSDLIFLAADRKLNLVLLDNKITGLAGTSLAVGIKKEELIGEPKTFLIKIGGTEHHQFVLDSASGIYFSDFTFPPIGEHEVYVEIDYGGGQNDSVSFKISSLKWGDVFGADSERLGKTQITLLSENGQRALMENYGQANPLLTNANGVYGWMIPNGIYSITAVKDGYYERRTANFSVNNNVINITLNLIAKPPALAEIIDPNATLGKNIGNVAKNLAEKTKAAAQVSFQDFTDTAKTAQEAADNPQVEKATEQYVAPVSAAAITAITIPLISWLDFLPFLRLLFLQPLMLIGARKREKWGLVYNSLNKLPVDLAIVRLINSITNKIIQSKVTDIQGHYVFAADPGKYRIEVTKGNFVFPSSLLAGLKNDGKRTDIYHGEIIEVNEGNASITATIPLDPAGEVKKPKRLVWEQWGRRFQTVVSWIGIIITAVSVYISPKWYIIALLFLHLFIFFIVQYFARRRKSKSWGIVYDADTKKPIIRAVARLFSSQFNKLVATQVTDNSGRYYFLAGDNRYYVTYDHPAYETLKSNEIDLIGKDAEAISIDVELKKAEKK
ncbi:MAG: hypothetical protein PHY40_03070 [Patescibacteria group bacterium]|nr:hypothetical protein [Patescibacteria group bacterium]